MLGARFAVVDEVEVSVGEFTMHKENLAVRRAARVAEIRPDAACLQRLFDITTGDDLTAADLDWLRAHAEATGGAWNSICADEGRWSLALGAALADCDKGVALAPRSPANLDSRALVLLRLGRLDEAIAGYDLALKLAPRQAISLYGRGLAKLGKGQGMAGQADLAAARAMRPHVDDVFAEYGLKPPEAYAATNAAAK